MEKKELKSYIDQGFSFVKISKIFNVHNSTIKYWAKKYNLKSSHEKFGYRIYGNTKFCSRCQTEQPIVNFYKRRNKENSYPYCKKCSRDITNEKYNIFKKHLVNYSIVTGKQNTIVTGKQIGRAHV